MNERNNFRETTVENNLKKFFQGSEAWYEQNKQSQFVLSLKELVNHIVFNINQKQDYIHFKEEHFHELFESLTRYAENSDVEMRNALDKFKSHYSNYKF